MAMRGYRSLDGGATVRAKIALSDIVDVWVKSLTVADDIAPCEYEPGMFFDVHGITLKQGTKVYRYQLDVRDSDDNLFWTILIDPKGYAKIEIRYGAQRDKMYLNLEYRKLFEYLHIRILEERISRVDLAITFERPISQVVNHVMNGCFYSLLNRKNLVVYGNPQSPNSVRLGDISNVEVSIYDKSKELFDHAFEVKNGLKLDDYYNYFGNSGEVTRIEYRLGRKYLHNIGVESPDDVNTNVFDLYVTMQERYFKPLDRVPDGHHAFKASQWWDELPPLVQKVKDQQGRIMFNIDLLSPVSWQEKYKMMMSRAQGYIASLVASMARVPRNIDDSMQIIFRRLIEDSAIIYQRAKSRFVLT